MKTIAIEINHVIRNLNYQLYKYYKKEFDDTIDLDEIDDEVDPFETVCKFKNEKEKNQFLYIDYPFEIFGCADEVEKNVQTFINNFVYDNDDEVKIVLFSPYSDPLSIQSTYFFLSKTSCRVKSVVFVENLDDIWEHCDIVITANNNYLTSEVPDGKKIVKINRKFNASTPINKDAIIAEYDNFSALYKDKENFFELINKE